MVAIKDMEMPKGCQHCRFFRKHMFGNGFDYSYSCLYGATQFPMPWIRQMEERASDCPLVEIITCEDAVSRQAVLGMTKSYCTDGYDRYTPLVVDVEDIEDLPPVTPTRKVGKWVYKNGAYICPFCGHQITGREEDLLFCCKCGERMKGVEDTAFNDCFELINNMIKEYEE